LVSPLDERFPQTMKKIGIIALILAVILWIINYMRNDGPVEFDSNE
jgi:hypothetical protein